MASVFKLGRNKGKKGSPWHFEFKDENGKKRMRKGFTDKGATKQLAIKLETEAELRRKGLIDVEQEQIANRKKSLVAPLLDAFKNSLTGRGNTEKHVGLTMGRIRAIVNGCEWNSVGEMKADDVEAFMFELQEEKGIGNRTYFQPVCGDCETESSG